MVDGSENGGRTPLLDSKEHDEPSVFTPESLIQEARRQKELSEVKVPEVCVLDPDGDLVRYLMDSGEAEVEGSWPGYHTELHRFEHLGTEYGVVGCAVGSPFAVLVAEQLFSSGCELLVSVTSSGQILERDDPPYFVLVEQALRDEGTSLHYRRPSPYADGDHELLDAVSDELSGVSRPVYRGRSWTIDAPFRETETAIARARDEDVLAVEMEASALYTFAESRDEDVVCFAHVTNQMGRAEEEFEKGEHQGSIATLEVVEAAVSGWRSHRNP